MNSKMLMRFIPVAFMLAFLASGCAKQTDSTAQAPVPETAAAKKEDPNVYKGPIVGRSNKAKTISITVGQGDAAKTMMVKFDDSTEGLDFAKKGEAAIIKWEQRGEDKFATVVEPKLAKLPKGVTEIKTDELYKMLQDHVPMVLADARPVIRFNQGHLPGAVSIPVPLLKEQKEAVLPKDKNKLLVFYCGGYT